MHKHKWPKSGRIEPENEKLRHTCDCPVPIMLGRGNPETGPWLTIHVCCLAKAVEEKLGVDVTDFFEAKK